jgi:hypothetical protein
MPLDVGPNRYVGDEPGEMGDALPVVDLGPGRTGSRVAVGDAGACVLRDDGSLRCWVRGHAGPADIAPPAGKRIVDLAGSYIAGVLFDDGSVSDVLYDESAGPALSWRSFIIDSGRSAQALVKAPHGRTLCAVLDDGEISCGYLLPYMTPDGLRGPDLIGYSFAEFSGPCALYRDGRVRCNAGTQGNEAWLDPGDDPTQNAHPVRLGLPAVDLVGGGYTHQCARLSDGSVRCWAESLSRAEPALGASFPDADLPDAGASARWLPIDLGTRPAEGP